MTIVSRATAVAFASVLLMGTALAQNAPPAAAPAAPAAKSDTMAKPAAKERTPESIECSKEADAKGLKGKERKKFRSQCKKDAKTKAKQ
ncbi:MAG: PsiF family protein [Xanthobacteraceae bacterium]|nr:PsiF family protein [Xanthobacteraceae bacterium]